MKKKKKTFHLKKFMKISTIALLDKSITGMLFFWGLAYTYCILCGHIILGQEISLGNMKKVEFTVQVIGVAYNVSMWACFFW
jgi:hypothetical protein